MEDALIVAAVAITLHLKTLWGGFVWDDRAAIVSNPDVRPGAPWLPILRHDFWGQDISVDTSHKSYRPLATVSYRIVQITTSAVCDVSHHLGGGGWYCCSKGESGGGAVGPAWSHHLANVVVHALVCALAVPLFQRLFRRQWPPAALSYALFTVHAIHVEPIAALVGRADLLGGLFTVLALLPHLPRFRSMGKASSAVARPPHTCYFLMSLICGCAAAASKETGVTVFGVMAAWEMVRVLEGIWHSQKELAQHRKLPLIDFIKMTVRRSYAKEGSGPLWRMAAAGVTALTVIVGHLWLHKGAPVRNWGVLENDIAILPSRRDRVLSYAFTHWMYAWKLIWPAELSFDWGYRCIPHVTSFSDVRNLGPLLLYATLGGLLWVGLATHNGPLLRAWALTVLPFTPASQVFFPVGTILAERLLYVPSLGACALVGCCLYRRPEKAKAKHAQPPEPITEEQRIATNEQLEHTEENIDVPVKRRKSVTFAEEEPKKRKLKKGKPGPQLEVEDDVVAQNKNVWLSIIGWLAVCLWVVMSARKTWCRCDDWKDEATLYRAGLEVCPEGIKIMSNVAITMLTPQQAEEAGKLLDRALQLYPEFPAASYNRGITHYLAGNHSLAIQYLERAILMEPTLAKAHLYLGVVKLKHVYPAQKAMSENAHPGSAHETLDAVNKHVMQAWELGVALPLAPLTKAQCLEEMGLLQEAFVWYGKAIDVNERLESAGAPRNDLISAPDVWNSFGLAARAGVSIDKGLEVFEAALKNFPDSFIILVNYASTLQRAGRFHDARKAYSRAQHMAPDSPELSNNLGYLSEEEGSFEDAMYHYMRASDLVRDSEAREASATLSAVRVQIDANLRNLEHRMRIQRGEQQ